MESFNVENYVSKVEIEQFDKLTFNDDSKILFSKYSRHPFSVTKQETFDRCFDILTSNLFLAVNWNNMIVAGGSVLAIYTNDQVKAESFSDIDIFLYGLSERGYNSKLIEIYNSFRQVYTGEIQISRTQWAVTFIFGGGIKNVQIIVRGYNSELDVLNSFDIDCCKVGYNGSRVFGTPEFYRALYTGYNYVSGSNISLSYETRLAKYGRRGFKVYIPEYDSSRLNNQIFKFPSTSVHGLARLLVLEKSDSTLTNEMYKDAMDFFQGTMRRNINLKTSYDRILSVPESKESGYEPKTRKEIDYSKKPKSIAKELREENTKASCRLFFVSDSISEIISGPSSPDVCSDKMKIKSVNGRIEWNRSDVVDDIFTRNTEPDENEVREWYGSAYLSENTLDTLIDIITKGKSIDDFISEHSDFDFNQRDFLNRVPLHEAVISGQINTVTKILELNGNIKFVSKLKKTAFHTACECGNLEVVDLFVTKDSTVLDETDSYGLNGLLYCIVYGHFDLFTYLFNKTSNKTNIYWYFKTDNNHSYGILQMCMLYRRTDIAKFLLDKKYDINDNNSKIITNCLRHRNFDMLKLIISHKYSYLINNDHIGDSERVISELISDIRTVKDPVIDMIIFGAMNVCKSSKLIHELFGKIIRMSNKTVSDISYFFQVHCPKLNGSKLLDLKKLYNQLDFDTSVTEIVDELTVPCFTFEFPVYENTYQPIPSKLIESIVENFKEVNTRVVKKSVNIPGTKDFTPIREYIIESLKSDNINLPFQNADVKLELCEDIDTDNEDDIDYVKIPSKKVTSFKTISFKLPTTCDVVKYYKFCDDIIEHRNKEAIEFIKTNDFKPDITFGGSKYTIAWICRQFSNYEVAKELLEFLAKTDYNTRFIQDFIINTFEIHSTIYSKVTELENQSIIDSTLIKMLINNVTLENKNIFSDYFKLYMDVGILDIELCIKLGKTYLFSELYNKYTGFKSAFITDIINNVKSTETALEFLKLIPDIDCSKYVPIASKSGRMEIFQYLLETYGTLPCLGTNVLQLMIDSKCNLNDINIVATKYPEMVTEQCGPVGNTSLHIAIMKHDHGTFNNLITMVQESQQNIVNNYGNTLLHQAVLSSNYTAFMMLKYHCHENYFRMTPKDYSYTLIKSKFHISRMGTHVVTPEILCNIAAIYDETKSKSNIAVVHASNESVNKTNQFLLDLIEERSQLNVLYNILDVY